MKIETKGYKITKVAGLEEIHIRRAGYEGSPNQYVEIEIVPAPDTVLSYDIAGLEDLIRGLESAFTHAQDMAREIERDNANG